MEQIFLLGFRLAVNKAKDKESLPAHFLEIDTKSFQSKKLKLHKPAFRLILSQGILLMIQGKLHISTKAKNSYLMSAQTGLEVESVFA